MHMVHLLIAGGAAFCLGWHDVLAKQNYMRALPALSCP